MFFRDLHRWRKCSSQGRSVPRCRNELVDDRGERLVAAGAAQRHPREQLERDSVGAADAHAGRLVGRRPRANPPVQPHLLVGRGGQRAGHPDAGAEPAHAHHHQRLPAQPGGVRPAARRLLHALHPHRRPPQGLRVRRTLVQTHPLFAR